MRSARITCFLFYVCWMDSKTIQRFFSADWSQNRKCGESAALIFIYRKAGLTPKSASPAIAKSNKSNCLSTKLRRLIWSWNSELNYRNSPISRCPAALSLRDFSVNRIPFDLIILVLFFSSNRASDISPLTSKILSVVKYILTSVRKGSRNGRSKMDRHPK